jgi:hypothetical protein
MENPLGGCRLDFEVVASRQKESIDSVDSSAENPEDELMSCGEAN